MKFLLVTILLVSSIYALNYNDLGKKYGVIKKSGESEFSYNFRVLQISYDYNFALVKKSNDTDEGFNLEIKNVYTSSLLDIQNKEWQMGKKSRLETDKIWANIMKKHKRHEEESSSMGGLVGASLKKANDQEYYRNIENMQKKYFAMIEKENAIRKGIYLKKAYMILNLDISKNQDHKYDNLIIYLKNKIRNMQEDYRKLTGYYYKLN